MTADGFFVDVFVDMLSVFSGKRSCYCLSLQEFLALLLGLDKSK
jgi:hypothetical protein